MPSASSWPMSVPSALRAPAPVNQGVRPAERMNIRPATAADAKAISSLIAETAHHFMLHPSGRGAERFLEGITPQAIAGYVASPSYYYLVAVSGPEVVGAVALRDGRHLFHLFVAPNRQRQGIARALWSAAMKGAAPDLEALTVNSSPNAVVVYEKFGFTPTGSRTEMHGIAFIPMKAAVLARQT